MDEWGYDDEVFLNRHDLVVAQALLDFYKTRDPMDDVGFVDFTVSAYERTEWTWLVDAVRNDGVRPWETEYHYDPGNSACFYVYAWAYICVAAHHLVSSGH